jgi:hypothetical protein
MMKKFFILLVLMSLSFSEALTCSSNATKYILDFDDNKVLLPVILALTVFIIVIAFIIGKTTNNQAFIIFYKDELFHLFFSLILLAGFSGILYFSCEATKAFLDFSFSAAGVDDPCASKETLLDVSYCFTDKIYSEARQFSSSLIECMIDSTMHSTWGLSLYIPFFGGISVLTHAYRKTYALQYDSLNTIYIIPSLISLGMQKLFIQFIIDYGEMYLLPLGFFLRLFPGTRQIGNLVIAFALGLFTIIPLMYSLNLAMYTLKPAYDQSITTDHVLQACNGYTFDNAAKLIPQAFFLPNLTLAIFITYTSAVNKALKVLG